MRVLRVLSLRLLNMYADCCRVVYGSVFVEMCRFVSQGMIGHSMYSFGSVLFAIFRPRVLVRPSLCLDYSLALSFGGRMCLWYLQNTMADI